MGIKVALVGNPNSGKTTLFNGLTGSNQSVGNWPGVTVEKKTGKAILGESEAEIIDLPGLYSLSTLSLEEEVSATFVLQQKMDVIVNIVDASNLERNLFLTHQLLESGLPMVIALNCMDIVRKRMEDINIPKLAERLGVPVIPITASRKHGLLDLMRQVELIVGKLRPSMPRYSEALERAVDRLEALLGSRFLAYRFFEDGKKGISAVHFDEPVLHALEAVMVEESRHFSVDADMVLPAERYDRILSICAEVLAKPVQAVDNVTDRIDQILTHKWFGLPIFGSVMFLVFYLAFGPLGTWITDGFVGLIDAFFGWIESGIVALGMAPWVSSLIVRGVFGGLAAVVGFLPQLAILFLFLALLEDSGYMARAAFIMDRAMRRFGLSGKSFIPMLLGFGCSVPAVTATRTLDRPEDRRITTMVIPFVSCGAKAPIYAVFAGALFASHSYLVVFSMYLLGIIVALLSAVLFKKTIMKGSSANYLMELPEYRMPTPKNVLLHTWERSKGFLVKAMTVLLGAFIVIWFLSYFGFVDGTFRLLENNEIEFSLLGYLGKFILPLFRPIGFSDWRPAVAILTGFVAKESVVGTLGILYGIQGDVVQNGSLLFSSIQTAFSPVQAYAFMAFALLGSPCIAALTAMSKELRSRKWFAFIVVYEMMVAYLVALLIFQLGSADTGSLLSAIVAGGAILIVFATVRRVLKRRGNTCGSCHGCAIEGSCASKPEEKSGKS